MSKFSVLVQVRAYGVVCALVPTLPTFHSLKYNQTWSFFFKMRNKRKGEMQRGCEVHLLILCGHTYQHETSPWEHVGVWAYSSTACSLCSCTQPPHLFIITGLSTVATLTNHSGWVLNWGVSRRFPQALCCGWVHSFDLNLQRHVYGCCQSREVLRFIAA